MLFVESGCGVLRELRVVVRFAEERSGPFEEFEKLRKAAEVITGGEFVIFKRYGVFFGKGFDAVRLEHALEVQVEFGLWELAKEVFDFRDGNHLASLAGGEEKEGMPQSRRGTETEGREERRSLRTCVEKSGSWAAAIMQDGHLKVAATK